MMQRQDPKPPSRPSSCLSAAAALAFLKLLPSVFAQEDFPFDSFAAPFLIRRCITVVVPRRRQRGAAAVAFTWDDFLHAMRDNSAGASTSEPRGATSGRMCPRCKILNDAGEGGRVGHASHSEWDRVSASVKHQLGPGQSRPTQGRWSEGRATNLLTLRPASPNLLLNVCDSGVF